MANMAIFNRDKSDEPSNHILKRHAGLAEMNATVTEYGSLLEQVSAERADLLVRISKLQLENAELSVSKTLFSHLESELEELRNKVQDADRAIQERRKLRDQIDELENEQYELRKDIERLTESHAVELAELKAENATLKGQVTRLKNKVVYDG